MSKKESGSRVPQILRRKAEALVKKDEKKKDKDFQEADVKKLMHELQVHQIELEMQNEELREANETAETALKKYTLLYDFAPTGYFTLDINGKICQLNFTGAEILKDKRISLIDTNFRLFVSDDSMPVFNKFFKNLYESNARESCEVMLGYDSKTKCKVYMEGIVTGDDKLCLLTVIDTSKFKTS